MRFACIAIVWLSSGCASVHVGGGGGAQNMQDVARKLCRAVVR
jgi:hypothetical protein